MGVNEINTCCYPTDEEAPYLNFGNTLKALDWNRVRIIMKDLITLFSAKHLDIHMLASRLLDGPVLRWDRLKALEEKVTAHFALEDTGLYRSLALEHLESNWQ